MGASKYYDTEIDYLRKRSNGYTGWSTKENKCHVPSGVYNCLQLIGAAPICKVLDLGCGGGENAIVFSKMGYDVLGVDISKTAIEMARINALKKNTQKDKIQFKVLDIVTNNRIYKQNYDLYYIDSVLHFLTDKNDRFKLYENINNGISQIKNIYLSALTRSNLYRQSFLSLFEENEEGHLISHDSKRLLFDEQELLKELNLSGFDVVSYQSISQYHENEYMIFMNICGKTVG
ncbi:hypothetical protein CSA37_08885 [Candidatus Fermentibacteria bacterium]|nr:MAG: hypothetical protein CSA37_08885 [Candidatus Fermentibacteria bacterium]